jgi:hypothetical protein
MALNRRDILNSGRKVEAVDVPEWGGTVHLKVLSVAQLVAFMEAKDKLNVFEHFPLLISMSACDEAGNLLFGPDDLVALKEQGFEVLRRLGQAALKLNRIGPGDDEELAKNS